MCIRDRASTDGTVGEPMEGSTLGRELGDFDGSLEGAALGEEEGPVDGFMVGTSLGFEVGLLLGD